MKFCKHQDCAVCIDKKYRSIFGQVLRKKKPEIYLCKCAKYVVTNSVGEEIQLDNLDYVRNGGRGYYIIDPYRAEIVYLNKHNFQVVCTAAECEATLHVEIYYRNKKRQS